MKAARDAELLYRVAFENFSTKVRQVQVLTSLTSTETAEMEAALLDLERAHVTYNNARDQWVQYLLPSSSRRVHPTSLHQVHEDHEKCVRAIAELLWESAGRPEGTAAENWRKAEEIVKQAAAAA
jgi:DUF2934 family protein